MIWLDQHKDCLRQLALDGLTAEEIAAEMSRRFGRHIAKNSIIGAAHRNGVSFKRTAGFQPSTRAARWAMPRRSPVAAAPPLAPAQPISRPTVGALAFVHCTIVHATNATCRWPICDRYPMLFCGSPEADLTAGVPYCRKHSRLAYS